MSFEAFPEMWAGPLAPGVAAYERGLAEAEPFSQATSSTDRLGQLPATDVASVALHLRWPK
jgi:hypothetical protein